MLFLGLIIVTGVLSWLLWRHAERLSANGASYSQTEGWGIGAIFCLIAVVAFVFAVVIINATGYSSQVSDRSKVLQTSAVQGIEGHRAADLTTRIKVFLVEQYPNYEQSTIAKIVASDPGLLFLRFPELRAADTFVAYTHELTTLRNRIYDQEVLRQKLLAKIRARHNNKVIYIPGVT